MTTTGTLPYSQIWTGTITCTDNVTVPAGITLTIRPGAVVKFPSGKKLQINGDGTLIAEGTASNRITFNSTSSSKWTGIRLEQYSTASLKYCTIKTASYGVYINRACPNITFCDFENNNYGVYSYYGLDLNHVFSDNVFTACSNHGLYIVNPGGCDIVNCTVKNGTQYGIRLNNATASTALFGNTVRNNFQGVRLYNSDALFDSNRVYENATDGFYMEVGSDPDFNVRNDGRNVVARNTDYGIYVASGCWPVLRGSGTVGNSFYGNGARDFYSASSFWVDARYNYWGTVIDTSQIRFTGKVLVGNYLPVDPNAPLPAALPKVSAEKETAAEISSGEPPSDAKARALFEQAYALQLDKKYDAAITIYQQIITNFPSSYEAEQAVIRLARCYRKADKRTEGKSNLNAIASSKSAQAVGLAAHEICGGWDVADGLTQSAIAHYETVVRAGKARSQQALFDFVEHSFQYNRQFGAADVAAESI